MDNPSRFLLAVFGVEAALQSHTRSRVRLLQRTRGGEELFDVVQFGSEGQEFCFTGKLAWILGVESNASEIVANTKTHELIASELLAGQTIERQDRHPPGRQIYARRLAIIEPVSANLRVQKRLDHFTVRAKARVDVQWTRTRLALVHNIGKIHRYVTFLEHEGRIVLNKCISKRSLRDFDAHPNSFSTVALARNSTTQVVMLMQSLESHRWRLGNINPVIGRLA